MAHKTLIGGTAYEVTGGRTMVGGTAYDIAGGRTLVGGTAYDVAFGAGVAAIMLTFNSNSGTISINGTAYTADTTVEVELGSEVTVGCRGSGVMVAYVYFNGTQVGSGSTAQTIEYTFTAAGNVNIEVQKNGTFYQYFYITEV